MFQFRRGDSQCITINSGRGGRRKESGHLDRKEIFRRVKNQREPKKYKAIRREKRRSKASDERITPTETR